MRELFMSQPIDLFGKRFGRLVVFAWGNKDAWGSFRWLCRCDCGKEKEVRSGHLISGKIKSCGCLKASLSGPLSPVWKGGRSKTSSGYIILNPSCGGRGKLEHVAVMERFLGRELTEKETVHHKNGIRVDNRLENLELWASSHPSGQRVEDLTSWSIEHLRKYCPEILK